MELGSIANAGTTARRARRAGGIAALFAALALTAAQAVGTPASANAGPPDPGNDPFQSISNKMRLFTKQQDIGPTTDAIEKPMETDILEDRDMYDQRDGWYQPLLLTLHESSNMVLMQTIGVVPEFEFTPLFVEWLGIGEQELSANSLFAVREADVTLGVVGSGTFFVEEICHHLTFEATGRIHMLPELDTVIQSSLAQLGFAEHELSMLRAGLIPVIAIGKAGMVDDAWLLVSEWGGTEIAEPGMTVIYPFRPDPMDIVEGHPIVIPIIVGVAAGALLWGATDIIVRERDRRRCNKDRNRQLTGCMSRCAPLRYLACLDLPEGVICPVVARCNACCREIYRRHDLQGICSPHIPMNWGDLDQDYNDCWQNANNPNYPLPGDAPGSNGTGGWSNP